MMLMLHQPSEFQLLKINIIYAKYNNLFFPYVKYIMSETKELVTCDVFLTYTEQRDLEEIGKFVDYLVILNKMGADGDQTKLQAEQDYRNQITNYLSANKNQKWRQFNLAYRAKLN